MRAFVCACVLQILGHGRLRPAVSAGPHVVLWSFLHKWSLDRDGVPLHHIQHFSRNVYLHLPLPPPEKSTFSCVYPYKKRLFFQGESFLTMNEPLCWHEELKEKKKTSLKDFKVRRRVTAQPFCSCRSAKSTASASATHTAAEGCRQRARTVLWRRPPHGPAPATLLVLR